MKKAFWLVLSSAIVLTACDDKPKMTEQTKTTDQAKVTAEQPAQKPVSINYKQIALDKSKQARDASALAKDKSLQEKEAEKIAMKNQEESQIILKQ